MRFSLKPDFERSMERYEAFWAREVIDRPPVAISLPKAPAPVPQRPTPPCGSSGWTWTSGRSRRRSSWPTGSIWATRCPSLT